MFVQLYLCMLQASQIAHLVKDYMEELQARCLLSPNDNSQRMSRAFDLEDMDRQSVALPSLDPIRQEWKGCAEIRGQRTKQGQPAMQPPKPGCRAAFTCRWTGPGTERLVQVQYFRRTLWCWTASSWGGSHSQDWEAWKKEEEPHSRGIPWFGCGTQTKNVQESCASHCPATQEQFLVWQTSGSKCLCHLSSPRDFSVSVLLPWLRIACTRDGWTDHGHFDLADCVFLDLLLKLSHAREFL